MKVGIALRVQTIGFDTELCCLFPWDFWVEIFEAAKLEQVLVAPFLHSSPLTKWCALPLPLIRYTHGNVKCFVFFAADKLRDAPKERKVRERRAGGQEPGQDVAEGEAGEAEPDPGVGARGGGVRGVRGWCVLFIIVPC